MLERSIRDHWDLIAFSNYEGENYSYADVARHIHGFHVLFHKLGIKKEDKIALVGKNSANWCISYLSIISYGAVVVPIMPNFPPDDIHHLVNHSDSVLLFTNQSIFEQLDAQKMFNLKATISLDNFKPLHSEIKKSENNIRHLDEFIAGSSIHKEEFKLHHPEKKDLFAIIYTSGTSGFSKGVMLSHACLAANITYAQTYMPLKPGDKILSFLPLAHTYGCTVEFLYPFTLGCHITLLGKMPTIKLLMKAWQDVRPRLLLMVPLFIEKIYKKQVRPAIDKPVVRLLLRIPVFSDQIYRKIYNKLFNVFGGSFHEVVIGGAPLNEDVQRFLKKIKFPYTVGYGMTECGPLISYAGWKVNKINSAGRIVDTLKLKIDSYDPHNVVGEILVKGDNVMMGYYKNPEATAQAIDSDGWLHTGDLGTVDRDGFIFLRGRSKNMILGPSGQNIYPEEIEARINNLPYIQESLVVERKDKLCALIYPDLEMADAQKISESRLIGIFEENRKELNIQLPSYMQIAKFQIYPTEFEKTPKKSIKRYLYVNEE